MKNSNISEFIKHAESFGTVDEATQKFRNQCKEAGFSVVFSDGISSSEKVISILNSEPVQTLIKRMYDLTHQEGHELIIRNKKPNEK